MREHGEIEELLALEAIGGLEPADGERLAELRAEHGPDCAECAALEAGFRHTAAGLGAALAPARLSDDLEERTVAAALTEARSEPSPRPGRARAWLAVAAAIVLLAVGAIGGYLAAPRSSVAAFIQQPGVILVPFEQSTGAAGTMTLAIGPDGTDAYVIGTGLPTPPDGQVYELWTIAGDTPTAVGCVVPSDGHLAQKVDGAFSTADVAAVTVESAACPSAPTTDPVQVATLQSA